MDIITICNLKKYYGSGERIVRALDGVNLTVAQGEFIAIVGASGCGKTTLLNMMGGLDRPASGEVIVDGVNLASLKEAQLAVFRRKKAGFIFQNYNLVPTLTVEENIYFPLDLDCSTPDRKYLREIIELLGLQDKLAVFPEQLSGGQKQRAAIARALAAKPSVILADEPTGNLDSKNGQNVAGLLKMTTEIWHRTLVMVTHNPELAQMADRVIRMQDGRITEN
ncbi:MAG: ABC transporter ATP-binding protein [Lachnospiraceae bacterium]|nr:ABC transporter ATP-binding protein [Lachnospiraceae bacterium]